MATEARCDSDVCGMNKQISSLRTLCPRFSLVSESPTAEVPFLDEFENGGGGAIREQEQVLGGLCGLSSSRDRVNSVRAVQLDTGRQVRLHLRHRMPQHKSHTKGLCQPAQTSYITPEAGQG